jgi:hypothetical protein
MIGTDLLLLLVFVGAVRAAACLFEEWLDARDASRHVHR